MFIKCIDVFYLINICVQDNCKTFMTGINGEGMLRRES